MPESKLRTLSVDFAVQILNANKANQYSKRRREMKKLLLFTLLATTLNVLAHFPIGVNTDESRGFISNVDFAPLQLGVGFFDRWQLYDGKVNTFASFGCLGLMQESAVISFSLVSGIKKNYFLQCGLTACTEKNYFLSVSLINLIEHNYGLQIGVGNFSTHNSGIQIGMFNTGGFLQLGLLNYNPKSYIPFMPLSNFDMGKKE